MHHLSVTGLTKDFGGLRALNGIDLSVEKGEIRGIIGPNGSGKTTFVNMVTGMIPSTEGAIYFNGQDITHLKPHLITKLGISRTFQIPRILPGGTCLENVMLGQHCRHRLDLSGTFLRRPWTRSTQEEQIRRRSVQLLEFMELGDSVDRMAGSLSWVEEQLLQLCRALASEPQLLILDEPTSGMGETESRSVQKAIKKIRDNGVTMVVIAHDMRLIMEISDVVTCISFGNKIAEGNPRDVQRNEGVLEVYLGTK